METLISEPIAKIVAPLIALVATILAVFISSTKNKEIESLKQFHSLQFEYDKDLRIRRIDSYTDLCKRMALLAKYPQPEQLSIARIKELAFSFREWYFLGGGIIASEKARDCYFDLQDGLKIILQKYAKQWPTGEDAPKDAIELSVYLERDEGRPAPEKVLAIATSVLTEDGDFLPEELASKLRGLGSTLRTQMTEDVLTRQSSALKNESV